MYNNPFMNSYNQQNINDRIDGQIAQLQQMKEQMKNNQPVPTNLTQNFQIAPTHQSGMKYANSIDEVNKEMVYIDTPFFSKDMSVVWVKNTKGDIKTYELTEIIPKDSKDLKIEYLQAQIEELKKGMKVYESNANVSKPATEPIEDEVTTDVPNVSKSTKKQK